MAMGLFCAAALTLHAQTGSMVEAPSSAYLEIGGPGGLYSYNYERFIDEHFSARVGLANWATNTVDDQGEKVVAGIVSVSARLDISDYMGRGPGRYAEVGLAITRGSHSRNSYDIIEADGPFTTLVPLLGIRYQPLNGGFMYRAGYTPYVPLSGGAAQYPRQGIRSGGELSVGYAF